MNPDLNTHPAPELPQRAYLCVLSDALNKPIHIKIMEPERERYEKFCRDEAVYTILHKPQTKLYHTEITLYHFNDRHSIPAINTENNDFYSEELMKLLIAKNKEVEIEERKPLAHVISDFIHAMPPEYLKTKYELDLDTPKVWDAVSINKELAEDLLSHNGYHCYLLFGTPQETRIFPDTPNGINALKQYETFFGDHYFDPQLDYGWLQTARIWTDQPVLPKNGIVEEVIIDREVNPAEIGIPTRQSILDFSPDSLSYYRFVSNENITTSKNDELAALLLAEQMGLVADHSPDDPFRYAERFKDLKAEYGNAPDGNSCEIAIKKIKVRATQIIQEEGLVIRGRESKPAEKIEDEIIPAKQQGKNL